MTKKRAAPSATAAPAAKCSKPTAEALVGEARGTPFAPVAPDNRRLTPETIITALHHLQSDPLLKPLVEKLDGDSSPLWSIAGRNESGTVSSLGQFCCLAETRLRSRITVKLANELLTEVEQACGGAVTPASVTDNDALQQLLASKFQGAAKYDALQELAKFWQAQKDPDFGTVSSKSALGTLTKIKGFGEATVLTFLVKACARVDVLVESDGLIKAWLDKHKGVSKDGTDAKAMHQRLAATNAWQPWRSVACLLIWSEKAEAHPGVASVLAVA